MTQILVCAHPWVLVQAEQVSWYPGGEDKVYPPIYRCPVCSRTKNEGEPDPKVVLGKIEEDSK